MLAAADGPGGERTGWLATVTVGQTQAKRWLATGGNAFASVADIATDGEQAFFVWLHEAADGRPNRQQVRVWSAPAALAGAVGAEPITIKAQPWGISSLAVAFDRRRHLLSLITEDTSRSTKSPIMIGQTEWPPSPSRLGPDHVVRLDQRPLFLAAGPCSLPTVFVAGDDVLVTVHAGQRFGAFAAEGKAAQGVWLLGEAEGQRVIGDVLPVRSILGMTPSRRIVYGPGNQAGDVPFRAISYADVPLLP